VNHYSNRIAPPPESRKNPSVLITGASGFVGSHLVDYALAEQFTPCAGIRASSSKAYLQDPRIRFLHLPLSDVAKLTAQLRQYRAVHGVFDYVVHVAGIVNATDPQEFERVNFGYTKNLVDALMAADMVPKKMVYISSLSAFGPGGSDKTQRPDKAGYPAAIRHSDTPKPNTAYGKSKLQAERYLYSLPGFPFIILRPTGIYGPRDRGYLAYIKMVDSGFMPRMGYSPQYITFIHVKDLARVVFAALTAPWVRRAYFVADGDVYTTKAFSEIIKKHLGKKYVFSFPLPLWLVKAVAYTADALYRWRGRTPSSLNADKYPILTARSWICDTAPLRRDLHFTPACRLDESLKDLIADYRKEGLLAKRRPEKS
jgi:nucleoside-diphosphate-sugar epimerase